MFGRGTPYFYAFDLLWRDGKDLRDRSLVERKEELRMIVREKAARVLYTDHVEERGLALYEHVCRMDLEGIVAKPAESPYVTEKPLWIKIKNPDYSQAEGRGELFNGRR